MLLFDKEEFKEREKIDSEMSLEHAWNVMLYSTALATRLMDNEQVKELRIAKEICSKVILQEVMRPKENFDWKL